MPQNICLQAESSELIAQRIADSGPGLRRVSEIREAVYRAALAEIRALRGTKLPADDGPFSG